MEELTRQLIINSELNFTASYHNSILKKLYNKNKQDPNKIKLTGSL